MIFLHLPEADPHAIQRILGRIHQVNDTHSHETASNNLSLQGESYPENFLEPRYFTQNPREGYPAFAKGVVKAGGESLSSDALKRRKLWVRKYPENKNGFETSHPSFVHKVGVSPTI